MNIYDEILKTLKPKVKATTKPLTKDTEFKDIGIDSMTLLELVIEKEKEFKIEIPDAKLLEIKTIGDLVTVIEGLKQN